MIYTNSVSATDTFLTLAKSSGAGDLPDKTFTVQYAKDPNNPSWNNDNKKTYKAVMAKYYPAVGDRHAMDGRRRSCTRRKTPTAGEGVPRLRAHPFLLRQEERVGLVQVRNALISRAVGLLPPCTWNACATAMHSVSVTRPSGGTSP